MSKKFPLVNKFDDLIVEKLCWNSSCMAAHTPEIVLGF